MQLTKTTNSKCLLAKVESIKRKVECMFKIVAKRKFSLNTEIDHGWPTGWCNQPVDRRVSLGSFDCTRFCIEL